jgi:hypothetical protein
VEFIGDEERTTVVLVHSDFTSEESRDRHRGGWEGCLENLQARVFAPAARAS